MLKRFTLFLLSSLLITSLTVTVVGLSMNILLYPDIYQEAFATQDTYNYIETMIVEQGHVPRTIFISHPVQPTVDGLVENLLGYVRGEDDLDMTIDLNDTIKEFFVARAEQLPECQPGQIPMDGEEVVCRPAGVDPEAYIDLVMQTQDIDIPTEINLAEVLDQDGQLEKVRQAVDLMRDVVWISAILTFVFLGMIVFLTRKSFESMAEWIDYDLFSVAVSMFLVSYMVRTQLLTQISFPEQMGWLEGVVIHVVFAVLSLMQMYGFILAGAGVVVGAAALIKHFY